METIAFMTSAHNELFKPANNNQLHVVSILANGQKYSFPTFREAGKFFSLKMISTEELLKLIETHDHSDPILRDQLDKLTNQVFSKYF